MPPAEHTETLAALGICVGIAVFLILVILLGVVAIIEQVSKRGLKRFFPRRPQEEK